MGVPRGAEPKGGATGSYSAHPLDQSWTAQEGVNTMGSGSPVLCFCLTLFLAGCTAYVEAPGPDLQLTQGVIHPVMPGETLWRIAKHYGVEVEELARVNQISDASRLEVGQRLRIPLKKGPLPEATPAPFQGVETDLHPVEHQEFVWPLEGKVISIFGMRRSSTLNKGIDIQAPQGTDVLAAKSGQVSFIHEGLPGFGKTIILEHGDGFATVYAYVGQILVHQGERVTQRQVIARVGATGRTQVPALHFEVRRNQRPQNPFYYLP